MIKADKYLPTGDKSVGYPRICIRTNRTAERTDVKPIIEKAVEIGQQLPFSKPYEIIRLVFNQLGKDFGSGGFGHAWVIYFNSEEQGDYTSYAFHEGFGFVKNSEHTSTNDSPERNFHLQQCIKVNGDILNPGVIEEKIIADLVRESNALATLMHLTDKDLPGGVYTPVTNCSWFAGKLWQQMTKLVYEQPITDYIDVDYMAKRMGLPFISQIEEIGDPGMLAESIQYGCL